MLALGADFVLVGRPGGFKRSRRREEDFGLFKNRYKNRDDNDLVQYVGRYK